MLKNRGTNQECLDAFIFMNFYSSGVDGTVAHEKNSKIFRECSSTIKPLMLKVDLVFLTVRSDQNGRNYPVEWFEHE